MSKRSTSPIHHPNINHVMVEMESNKGGTFLTQSAAMSKSFSKSKKNVKLEEHEEEVKKPMGYPVSRQDIEEAFKFYSLNKKKITSKELKTRLKVFYPNMSNNEYKFLVSEQNFTVETLVKILENNTLQNYDPVREAFKVFDPKDTGYVDEELLASIMTQLGYGKITPEDMKVLLDTADLDSDGKISLEDFRSMTGKTLDETAANLTQ